MLPKRAAGTGKLLGCLVVGGGAPWRDSKEEAAGL